MIKIANLTSGVRHGRIIVIGTRASFHGVDGYKIQQLRLMLRTLKKDPMWASRLTWSKISDERGFFIIVRISEGGPNELVIDSIVVLYKVLDVLREDWSDLV